MKSRSIFLSICAFLLMLATMPGQSSQPDALPSAPSEAKDKAQPAAQAQQPTPVPSPSPESPTPDKPQENSAAPGANAKAETAAPAAQPVEPATAGDSQPAGPDDESISTIRRTVNEGNVVFTVTDKHGHYVKDLKKNDFKILDDAKQASDISSFRAETDLPLDVGLLIDASNSVRDRFKFEQESAIEFLNQTVRRKYDHAFVVGFDVTPEVTQDFTDDTEALSTGVRMLRPGGGTALYDALYFACRDKLLKVPHTGPVRKAVILLSDGDDNQSHVTREEAIEMAQRAEVIVYTISTNLSGAGSHGDKVLQRIADGTGGRAYIPFQLTEVANAFAAIQEELRSQYAISYKPPNFRADGRYRKIEILAQEKGLHVRSRPGYYAPSQ